METTVSMWLAMTVMWDRLSKVHTPGWGCRLMRDDPTWNVRVVPRTCNGPGEVGVNRHRGGTWTMKRLRKV
jgi:hypothetical protein